MPVPVKMRIATKMRNALTNFTGPTGNWWPRPRATLAIVGSGTEGMDCSARISTNAPKIVTIAICGIQFAKIPEDLTDAFVRADFWAKADFVPMKTNVERRRHAIKMPIVKICLGVTVAIAGRDSLAQRFVFVSHQIFQLIFHVYFLFQMKISTLCFYKWGGGRGGVRDGGGENSR